VGGSEWQTRRSRRRRVRKAESRRGSGCAASCAGLRRDRVRCSGLAAADSSASPDTCCTAWTCSILAIHVWPAVPIEDVGLIIRNDKLTLFRIVCSCAIRDLAIGVSYAIRPICYVLVTAVGQREHCFADAMHSLQHCTKTSPQSASPLRNNKGTYPLLDLLHKNSLLCADFS